MDRVYYQQNFTKEMSKGCNLEKKKINPKEHLACKK